MKFNFTFLIYACLLVAGCHPPYKGNKKKTAATRLSVTPADSLVQKQHTGIDLLVHGNFPLKWSVELDFEKGFFINTAGSRMLTAAPMKSVREAAQNSDIYRSKTDSGMMELVVFDELCSDAISGNTRSRKAELTLNNKRYSGCGAYLYNYLLNDTWTLESIDNTLLSKSDFKGQLPRLEFDLAKNMMSGYDGCNNIRASINIQGDDLSFSGFTGGKKTCGNAGIQKIFLTLLSGHSVDYRIRNEILTIYLVNDSRLVFRKAD